VQDKKESAGKKTAPAKKRDAKVKEKEDAQNVEATKQVKPEKATAKKQTKAKEKQEVAKDDEEDQTNPNQDHPEIDPRMYARRSVRNLGKTQVDYIEPKVNIKEFTYREESSSEEEEDDEDEQADNKNNEDAGKEKGEKQKVKKEKKKKERVKVLKKRKFRKGKWNPDVDIVDCTLYRDKPGSDLLGADDSVAIANLNLIRAASTNDMKLLHKVFYDKDAISNLNASWSADDPTTAFDIMIKNNNLKMIEFMLNPQFPDMELHQNYDSLRKEYFTNRAPETEEFI